ncbi:class I SAM-dependent methyltransferase [Peredibacter starrii]|uniref:Class I SAM-dependent methyltransferase n=1 Tax=Peredibacter starrii TaxID=28202 RepID=A0AAX4HM84_9BACT|nr:class I SAM-dependent methyltransferase [Peredibacter starrii]WPU64331.1 class I SAM-dependent methyltransferase [Peredibacter starrii]
MKTILERNKDAWNKQVDKKNQWTLPVSSEVIAKARQGEWSVVLTPEKPVPKEWFPSMQGLKILALASGGGQQAPIFAAAGAEVTVFDLSPNQLSQDRLVADRDNLKLRTVEGDMSDLSCFSNDSFDLIFHPCSNCFVPDVKPVWKEAFRVLKAGGTLISGFTNPVTLILDPEKEKQGIVELKHKLPYSDLTSITEEERVRLYGQDEPITFGHTLQDQIGGQIAAGFHLIGFYEDGWKSAGGINNLMDCFIATRALKPKS